jgi:A/G-specific adenine glycosylase
MPWRANRDPWPILVSELMLQQTRVEVVVRYFTPFMARFPTAEALAAAPESELLARWSGLGYYRRARALRAAAIEICRRGAMPSTAAELEALPGVGPYTAAAVASMAFGEVVGVVDGNVVRVMARRLALAGRAELAPARKRIREAVAALLDPVRPGDSNQALMELGATLCKPRRPRCGDCPLADGCLAFATGEPERYPEARARAKPVPIPVAAAAVERGGELLLVRRAADEELMPGLWELPAVEGEEPEPARFAARYGGDWRFGARRARVRHAITFRALTITLFDAQWTPHELAERDDAGWFGRDEALALPLTGAARKLIRRVSEGSGES